MNIFRLDDNVERCAEYQCNTHLVKMIVEHSQLMSTAHHVLGSRVDPSTIYKKTHVNHPSAVWARESKANYIWLWKLTRAMLTEYTYRYERIHAVESGGLINRLKKLPFLPDVGPTPQRLAMPERYHTSNPVVSYRNYYVNEKSHLFAWKKRPMPSWLIQFGFIPVEEF